MRVPNLVPIGPQTATCIRLEGYTHTHTHTLSYIDIDIFYLLSLSAWVKYYYRILQTHQARTHARTHARTRARMHERTHARVCMCTHPCKRVHTHTPPSPYRYSMGLCQPTVTARSAGDKSWSLAIEINTGGPVSLRF